MALALGGCTTSSTDAAAPGTGETGRPTVLTTFTVIADMARVVGGDRIEVASITKVGAEIHGYEPTPSDLRAAASASLILDNGLGLERWFESFVDRLDVPHAVLSDGVEPIAIKAGDYEGLPNPHAWMSPIAGQSYVDNVAAALAELLPEHAQEFERNAIAYKAELQAIADDLASTVESIPADHRMLVTCEGAFSYLARDLGLDEAYLWPVNSDTQGTPQQIKQAIETVRERQVPAVFCETTVNPASQQQVARESGAAFAGLLYVDSLSEADGPVPTYLDLLRYDVALIAEGLGGGAR
ncbi:metal ABC transporter substrate-binding protein [Klugiella sp. YN-L-19]|uniref:Metal ABC transporter substrate-binding protein n=1 Tax=Ruicaihuangia caeni TaxID=3042517 RepID=A0AAW6T0M3_9MICO|nr:metal ABC transporter substrate-binding protein [Klugiella sp. YN-L-19]MDI2097371.1 metal ABC transporter substrate-binding protein [Klugiella sp. YN-L-19]